jgi:hypothetical protein
LRNGSISDGQFLDAIQRTTFPATGLVKDWARANGTDTRTLSSIAATGFGLTALCIVASRNYEATGLIKKRVINTLNFLLTKAPTVKGFFYHFMDMNTGARWGLIEFAADRT